VPEGWPNVGRSEEIALVARALTARSTRCVLISGAAGVGKSRLAREAAARARQDRWAVRWATATRQTQGIALGAVAHLLPGQLSGTAPLDRFETFRWARRVLGEPGDQRAVTVIDDAPLLDELSAALVQQLVTSGSGSTLLLTARSDAMPEWLRSLARDDAVEHLRVEPLSEAEVVELIDAVLTGSVDPATHAMLWAQTRGNVLWLRQLMQDGLDSGALAKRSEVWGWQGPPSAPSLNDVLLSRLDGLREQERAAVELVAFGEPLPAPVVAALALADTLVSLERRDLVEADPRGGVRMAHPLLGSLLRDQVGDLAATAVRGRLVAAFQTSGSVHGTDALRVAHWQLESGDTSSPDRMIAAARRALTLDPVLAERFARAALRSRPDGAARYALARALLDQRRWAESSQLYAELLAGPLPPRLQAEATMDSAYFLFCAQQDAPGAMAQLRSVESTFGEFRAHAASLRAAVALFSGATAEALSAALPVTTEPAVDPRVLHLAAIAAVPALTVAGRVGEAIALAERARSSTAQHVIDAPGAAVGATTREAQLGWEYAFALRWAGRIDEALADASARLHLTAAETMRHPESYGLRNAAVGGAHLAAGDAQSALDALRVAASVLRDADQVGMLTSCLSDLARAEALTGDLQAAEALLAEATQHRNPAVHLFEAALGQARAVVAACGGELGRARDEASAAADLARTWKQPVLEAACLHLLTRFGGAADAAPRLAELAASTDAQLVHVFAADAQARTTADPDHLADVAARFAAAGARMLAANTAAAAARHYRQAGRGAAANRAGQRSRAWSARCPGTPLPSLLVEPAALTARERDVVALARRGLTNAQIAERLVLSARTVESHLQHAYTKLGVSSRTELADISVL
jgi:DNA-binding NarL/FixJ family response regulator